MGRPLRIDSADVLYHVTSRGNEGQAIVRDDGDRASQPFLKMRNFVKESRN